MHTPKQSLSAGVFLVMFTAALLSALTSAGQVKAGIKVNGTVKRLGDTIRVCKGASLSYSSSATNVNASNIIWKFKNGNPASYTGTDVSVQYNKSGIDTTFQYVSAGTKRDSVYIFIKVSDTKPTADFKFDPPGTNCGSEKITFTSTSTTEGKLNAYHWDFGDNATGNVNPATHSFTAATGNGTKSYDVTLMVTNDAGCSDTVAHSITVKQIPDASLGNADINVTGPG